MVLTNKSSAEKDDGCHRSFKFGLGDYCNEASCCRRFRRLLRQFSCLCALHIPNGTYHDHPQGQGLRMTGELPGLVPLIWRTLLQCQKMTLPSSISMKRTAHENKYQINFDLLDNFEQQPSYSALNSALHRHSSAVDVFSSFALTSSALTPQCA